MDRAPRRIEGIVNGNSATTADTALRLGKFFGMEAQVCVNLLSLYNLELAKDATADRLDREVSVFKGT